MTATERTNTGTAAGGSIDQTMRAVPIAVATLRRAVREFVVAHEAEEELQEDVALAVSEAVSNVVRHAYGTEAPGPVHFKATATDGAFEIHVSDDGHGFRAGHDPGLGMGLKLIAHTTADFRIEARDPGTTLVLRFLRAGSIPAVAPEGLRSGAASGGTVDEACVWTASDAYAAKDEQALLACLHPAIEARLLPVIGGAGRVASGPADVVELAAQFHAEDWSFAIEEMQTLPDGRVLAHGRAGTGGAGSAFCAVHELKDGLLFRVRHWFSTPEQLARLGYLDRGGDPV